MFLGKYIVNEALTLPKIHKNSVGFRNQNVVKSKSVMCLSSVWKIVLGKASVHRGDRGALQESALPCLALEKG